MANAEKKVEKQEVVTYVDVETVTLKLTVEEANLIHDMLHMASGSPERSRRGIADSVKETLRAVGINGYPSDNRRSYPSDITSGSVIYFMDQE